jgi:glycosyltransferase involved in cell wall biosynthesis
MQTREKPRLNTRTQLKGKSSAPVASEREISAGQSHPIAAVAWSPHDPRSTQYARRLGAELYKIHYLKWKRPLLAPFKYVLQNFKTWWVLARQRPKVIYVAVSPVFSALSVYLYCRVSGAKYIIDIHGSALHSRKWGWSVPLLRWLARRALANVIDQERHRALLESWGAKAFVLERAPVSVSVSELQAGERRVHDPEQFSVTVVNCFNEDEPLEPVYGAALLLPKVHFFVLGDTALAKKSLLKSAPSNVSFTGYLYNQDYWNRLYASNVIVVLTTQPYSLLGGAQDGLVLGKPLVLSDQPVLREYFTCGTVFVDNCAESLAMGITEAKVRRNALAWELEELAVEKRARWEDEFSKLLHLVGGVH